MRWSKEEVAVLKKYYPKEGGDVFKRLEGRNRGTCHKKANELRIPSGKRIKAWTKKEDSFMRKYYSQMGPAIVKMLPGRSREACRSRAMRLGLKFSGSDIPWSKEEITLMKEYYATEGTHISTRLIGRSRDACASKAKKLGLRYRGSIMIKDLILKALSDGMEDERMRLRIHIQGVSFEMELYEIDGKLFLSDNGTVSRFLGDSICLEYGMEMKNGAVTMPITDISRLEEHMVSFFLQIFRLRLISV